MAWNPQTAAPASDGRSWGGSLALRHGVTVGGLLLTVALLLLYASRHELAVDFRDNYWVAAHTLLHGGSPYAWTSAQIAARTGFAYPAFTGFALVPLAAIPVTAAATVFLIALLASVPCLLWVLGVRELALYGLAMLEWPVINAWQTGNLTLVLALLIALAWRHRDRPFVCAAVVALTISLKPLVWPLWLWLLATRRYRAAGLSLALAAAVNLTAFAVLGWHEIQAYVHLANVITAAAEHTGYGIPAMVLRAGGSAQLGVVAMVILALGLAALTVRVGRLGDDLGALALACVIAIEASPLVWNHYFALLIVPLAIAEPRLGRGWLILLAIWLCPALQVTEWQSVLAWAVTGLVVWTLVGKNRVASAPGRSQHAITHGGRLVDAGHVQETPVRVGCPAAGGGA